MRPGAVLGHPLHDLLGAFTILTHKQRRQRGVDAVGQADISQLVDARQR